MKRHPEGTRSQRNTFYHGDCLFVLTHDIPPESVDLIYLDPPFFTGKIQKGTKKWQPGAMEISFEDSKEFWGESKKMKAMRKRAPEWMKHIAIKRPDFASYLYYMMERLQACHRVLKDAGSIYLHCDYRASHYLKMIMDEIFEVENFRNEIVWHYDIGTAPKKDLKRKHDIIFRYSKSKDYIYNEQRIVPFNPERYNKVDPDGRRYFIRGDSGKRCYLDEGVSPDDVWTFVREKDFRALNSMAKERTGYPTQKPEAVLERIIKASSNEDDLVLDPFCGCGTAIVVAHQFNRRWIGVDINITAYETTKGREVQMPLGMRDEFAKANYISRDLEEVGSMGANEFEKWVNEFYGATKPLPDKGVDGVTKDDVPIQTKTGQVDYGIVSQFLSDAQLHPKVFQPVKQMVIVSQTGFDDSARIRAFEIKTKFGIEIQLKEPKDLLLVSENQI